MALVVTSFGEKGYQEYGARFLADWERCWPREIPLVCYVESGHAARAGVEFRRLFKVPAFEAFFRRHEHSAFAQGRVQAPCWKPKDVRLAYSFRTDAFKFCRKVFALADAIERTDAEVVAWLDADVTTLRRIPRNFVETMLGPADYAYLGREPMHSECGFVAYRRDTARLIVEEMARLYTSDEVFNLKEWHDSYVFDWVRTRLPELVGRSLTKPGTEGHVWCWSPLAPWLDHNKGDRKKLGFSPERFEKP